MRFLACFLLAFLTFATVKAQDTLNKYSQSETKKIDTIKPADYVNQGKIAGRKAAMKSLIFPGLGQIYNYGLVVKDVQSGAVPGKRVAQKIYIISKISAIYVGGFFLVNSYIDNRNNYKLFLNELQYRKLNNNQANPANGLDKYTNTDALVVAKNIYKRNYQIVLISLGGLYGLNVLDAYVTARLKYFNVNETLSFKLVPSFIHSTQMYGFNAPVPALKLTLKL